MKTLILMRHGRYAEDPQNKNIILCNQGIVEVFDISKKLSAEFNVNSIMYSPILRTTEAAFVAQQNMTKAKMKETDWLMEDYDNPSDKDGKGIETHLHKLDNKKDTICLVTHEPLIVKFMLYAGSKESVRSYYSGLMQDSSKSIREAIVFKFDIDKWEDIEKNTENGVKTNFTIVEGSYSPEKFVEAYNKCAKLDISKMLSKKDKTVDMKTPGQVKRSIFNNLKIVS